MTRSSLIILLYLSIFFTWTSTVAQSIDPPPNADISCSVQWPDICPAIYDPVCVPDPKMCITTPCFQTAEFPNSCEACKTSGVQTYRPGRCQYSCETMNLPPSALDTRDNPVCANYQENCQDVACRNTFRRSTLACQDPGVVSFTLGICPEDEWIFNEEEFSFEEGQEEYNIEEEEDQVGELIVVPNQPVQPEPPVPAQPIEAIITCLDPRPEICPDVSNPVCVTACRDNQCRYTVPNSCNACMDANVISYTPAACEADRFQCDAPNALPEDNICVDQLASVCAYSFACTAEPCGTTAGNSCEACDLLGFDYYTLGSCL